MAILAIFGGYFGYFLQNGRFLNSMIYHFGEPTGWAKKWPNQIFCQIDLDGEIVEMTCDQFGLVFYSVLYEKNLM